jgi:hypothetical protein
MGDRANIVIREDWPEDLGPSEAVFLYGHWSGEGLPERLRQALAKRWRWDDLSYLARICFEQMIGEQVGTETSFGISTRLTDNEYPLLVLRGQRVYVLAAADYEAHGFETLSEAPSVSFEDYIATEPRTWENLPSGAEVAS